MLGWAGGILTSVGAAIVGYVVHGEWKIFSSLLCATFHVGVPFVSWPDGKKTECHFAGCACAYVYAQYMRS